MMTRLTADLCVIGGGSGGLTVAAAAAAFAVPVVLIERHRMGGDCLNVGCVPSKALLAAARRVHAIRGAGAFGIAAPEPTVDFAAVMAHVRAVQAAIAPNDSVERFRGLGVTVLKAAARFTAPDLVVAGDHEIRARRFVVATGSSPAVPPIPGLAETRFFTNDTIWDLVELPRHLAIIGGGPIGLELAQAFRRLGAQVTVLEAAQPLAKDDAECASVVLDALRRDGVELHDRATVTSVGETAAGITVTFERGGATAALTASHLVVATGRRPNVEGLGLDAAGIAASSRGIAVDRGLRTSNRRVYAIGDVTGGPMFTHVAGWQGALVVRNALFRLPISAETDGVPWVTFTDPELAHVGLDEGRAKQRHSAIRVLHWPFHDNDRAQAERQTAGLVKVVTSARGQILGATIVGPQAGEMINMWSLAIAQRLSIRAFTSYMSPYPTFSEVGKRAAIGFFTPRLTSPLVKRMIRLLRWLG